MGDWLAWKEVLTLSVALLGAALGIMNTWHAISQRRVRLCVKPAYAIGVPNGEISFSIEVVNLSSFPVTLAEVGFAMRGGKRLAVTQPFFVDGGPWPRRLESREAMSAYFDPAEIAVHRQPIGKAYTRTTCGEIAYGSSPALRQLRSLIPTS